MRSYPTCRPSAAVVGETAGGYDAGGPGDGGDPGPVAPADAAAAGPDSGDGESPLAELQQVARALHGLHDRLLRAVLAARAWGGMGGAVGMDTAAYLELVERVPRPVVNRVMAVASRLEVMPACAQAWSDRVVTFDELADLVRAAGGFNGERLSLLDQELACLAVDLTAEDRLADLGWEADVRVQRLKAPGWANRQERRARAGRQVTIQQDFDGGGLLFANLDKVGLHTVAGTLHAWAGPPTRGTPRRRQLADALVEACEAAMGDSNGKGRPTLMLAVDIATATSDRFGQLLTAAGGAAIPTLSARATETIAEHAELLLQITNGRHPLAELRAKDIPAAVRRATMVRDKGSRWPGDTAAALGCQTHHTAGRNHDGEHPVQQLVLLPLRHHQLGVEKHGWQVHIDPTTARATFEHPDSGIRLATMPRGTAPGWDWRTWPLGELPDWLAPPRPPPPDHAPPRSEPDRDGHDPPPGLDLVLPRDGPSARDGPAP